MRMLGTSALSFVDLFNIIIISILFDHGPKGLSEVQNLSPSIVQRQFEPLIRGG